LAYLRSEAGVAAIRGISRSTSDQLSITARDLGDIEVPVPPLAEQASIHALVDASEIAYAAALTAAAQRRVAIQAIALNMLHNTTTN
jgi:restriction endonuclease S subunit